MDKTYEFPDGSCLQVVDGEADYIDSLGNHREFELWAHGAPARSVKQATDYLDGDAHDQTKFAILITDVGPFGRFYYPY